MKKKITLLIDAAINFILAVLLLSYSPGTVKFLGIPSTDNYFYPNILGAVLLGITIALVLEAYNKNHNYTGLGLIGAISINMCGGIVLLYWLILGGLNMPAKGSLFLWILDLLLIVISTAELFVHFKNAKK